MKRLLSITLWLFFFALFELIFSSNDVFAANAIIRPDGNISAQWTPVNSATNYGAINKIVTQPTAPDTNSHVHNNSNNTLVDRYSFENISNVLSTSSITVRLYTSCTSTNTAFHWTLYSGTTQLAKDRFSVGTSYAWFNTSSISVNLDQAQTNNLELSIQVQQDSRTCYLAALYLDVTYTEAAAISISLDTDGVVDFGKIPLDTTIDTTAGGIDDVEVIRVDSGPADLTVQSTNFAGDPTGSWTLDSSSGTDQVLWEFSSNGSSWNPFLVPNTNYSFASNVATNDTRNLYLRLNMPSSVSFFNPHSATITITATAP